MNRVIRYRSSCENYFEMSSYIFIYYCAFYFLGFIHSSSGSCYFPLELQGEYVMQTSITSGQVQYSQINITADAIPIWGQCHKRVRSNNVMLIDIFSGGNCTRCLHIKLRSRNVIQILTEGLGACYTTEEAAEATCPKDNMLQYYNNQEKSILLYKTKDVALASLDGIGDIKYEYCPINGKFQFVYNNDGSEIKMECLRPLSSEIDNCPNGSELNVRFRGCSFDNHDIKFKCLGNWDGPDNQKYFALLDAREGIEGSPKYRCALMKEEIGSGKIHLAFSSDSTCFADLKSSRDGYEKLTLSSIPTLPWPETVQLSSCTFPGWTQGYWESVYIDGNLLTYKDQINFKTYSIKCIEASLDKHDRYHIFARSQCGEEFYSCIRMKKRGLNVLEFQLGLKSTNHMNTTSCADSNFEPSKWITQGRLERYQESPCPITGAYYGMIPDSDGLCAKLSSDCTSPETMYYTVVDCNMPEIYEETKLARKYRKGRDLLNIPSPISELTSNYPLETQNFVPSVSFINNTNSLPVNFTITNSSTLLDVINIYPTPSTPLVIVPEIITDDIIVAHQISNFSLTPISIQIPIIPITTSFEIPNSNLRYESQETQNPSIMLTSTIKLDTETNKLHENENIARNPAPYHVTESSYFGGLANFNFKINNYPPSMPNNYNLQRNQPANRQKSDNNYNMLIPDFKIPTASHNDGRTLTQGSSLPNNNKLYQIPQYSNQSLHLNPYYTQNNYYINKHPNNYTPVSSPSRLLPKFERQRPHSFILPTLSSSDSFYDQNHRGDIKHFATPLPINQNLNQQNYVRNTRQKIPIALPPIQIPHSFVPIPLPRRMNPADILRQRELHHLKYKERQYRCLGQWTESGLTYTYTQRKDLGTYECFVGAIVSNDEIFIKEAGEHCGRELNPSEYGMRLSRKGSCTGDLPEPVPITERVTTTTTTTTTTLPPPTTTTRSPWTSSTKRPTAANRPWKPITAPPPYRVREEVANSSSQSSFILPISIFTTLSIILHCYLN